MSLGTFGEVWGLKFLGEPIKKLIWVGEPCGGTKNNSNGVGECIKQFETKSVGVNAARTVMLSSLFVLVVCFVLIRVTRVIRYRHDDMSSFCHLYRFSLIDKSDLHRLIGPHMIM